VEATGEGSRVSELKRLVIESKPEELVIRVLYGSHDGPNPGTKARTRVVSELARTGLRDALKTLGGRVDVVGSSGYGVREDVLLATPSPSEAKLVKGA
jgi:hypothetical protein